MCVCYHPNNIEAGGNQSASQKGKRVQAAPPNLYFPNPPSEPIRFDVDDDVVDWAGPAHTIARVISFNLGPKDSLVLAWKIPSYPCL